MKQLSPITSIVDLFSSIGEGGGLHVTGFHPDFLLSFIHAINKKLFITINDKLFSSSAKYLSSLWENPSVVFVSAPGACSGGPLGFASSDSRFVLRAKEVLAGGLEPIKTIICSGGGMSLPILGCGVNHNLVFSAGVSYDECRGFLLSENYVLSDFVTMPGEYSLRGGIIDVFPFSSYHPYRINFLDKLPIVFRFNVDSQLTSDRVNNFVLSSLSKNKPLSLEDVSLEAFLPVSIDSSGNLVMGEPNKILKRVRLKAITHRKFCATHKNSLSSVGVSEHLSSVGVSDENYNIFVPLWFANKGPFKEKKGKGAIPLDLGEINRGDYLVHRDHGVGMCVGLALKEGGRSVQELLSIKYKDGAIISTDIGSLDLIAFFAPAGTDGVVLDSLSKKGGWARKKLSATRRAEDIIQHLLNLYVKRRGTARAAFSQDSSLEKPFLEAFPFDETPDQVVAWQDISEDLSGNHPMDRLLCGDVGFGKTELAIRAAFRVAVSGKRVVVLSPTTILANQLLSSFSARLGPSAISVDMVSRFRSQGELGTIKKDICKNNNDVLIGTHAVLNDDVYLKNIGLLIIDEEHRFGVRHKEKIRQFKSSIDVLSMSATPIPRSMNLALTGIYSVSMLQTPPRLRLPIITEIEYYSEETICAAIGFEVGRGGQVYFVHNDVLSINRVADKLQSLFSKNTVRFIHGQEPSKKIEEKMRAFVSGGVDILVCTSIIESGIDVPSANCIIINNAHLFGLAQLYQMRGRVGRGQQQAYAHLLIPRGMSLSEKAFKRIKSIEENISLGSGYNVSTTDMEIRGSGSLFGYKQSGGGGSMGYEMYTRMIQRALHKSGGLGLDFLILPEDVVIELYSRRFIPEKYIALESVRMSVYKGLAVATTEKGINDILYNLVNRFGPAPISVINIINESRLRLAASRAGVCSVVLRSCGVVCSVRGGRGAPLASALLDYADGFFKERGIKYHIIPKSADLLILCVHLAKNEDSYALFSRFFGKFHGLVKVN